ncbi:MAG: enoyl-CoA hydratase/isomerase family protein [Parvibaculaceae bacterium]
MAGAVECEVRDSVAFVTLNRPEKLNAINEDVLNGLYDAADRIATSDGIRAAVLSGRGRAFSAGGDIKAMEAMQDRGFANTISLYMRVAASFRACPKPIIAAVHGYALAGGFELMLLCDVRIAARDTQFGLPDTALGLSPTSGMTYLLPRIVGLGRAMDLTLSAENIDAEEALRIGLVNRLVEGDVLMADAQRYAGKLASYPSVGLAYTKSGFYRALDAEHGTATRLEEEGELACFRSAEVKQRFRDFLNRKR